MKTLKFDVFGRDVAIIKTESGWQAFYTASAGKRRPARDIIVPWNITESEMTQYLDDLCHEWATDRNKNVTRID
jgi:hypothetical protein